MPRRPQFASPTAPEWQAYWEEVRRRILSRDETPVPLPDDPLRTYQLAQGRRPKKPISLRVDEWLLELTKEMARQHDMRYQELMRMFIREGLRKAMREAAGSSQEGR